MIRPRPLHSSAFSWSRQALPPRRRRRRLRRCRHRPGTAWQGGTRRKGGRSSASYTPIELGGAGQNWAVVQDARGVIYVGSASGVLEFDGGLVAADRNAELNVVRSLAIDGAGRIYAGSVGDFGYLEPDAQGAMRYVSMGRSAAGRRAAVRRHLAHLSPPATGWCSRASSWLFRWAKDAFEVFRPTSRFNRGFARRWPGST